MATPIETAQRALTRAENHLASYQPTRREPWLNPSIVGWLCFVILWLSISAALLLVNGKLAPPAGNQHQLEQAILIMFTSILVAVLLCVVGGMHLWFKLITGRTGRWMERVGIVMVCPGNMTDQINHQLAGDDGFLQEQARRLTQACEGCAMSLQCAVALVDYLDRKIELKRAEISLQCKQKQQEEMKNSPLGQMREQAAQAAALERETPGANTGGQPGPRL